MGIDIIPSDVIRSADAVDAAGRQAGSGDLPTPSGNDGFTTTAAISTFMVQLHQTMELTVTDTATTAERLVASASLMRHVDDLAAEAARRLWTRLDPGGERS